MSHVLPRDVSDTSSRRAASIRHRPRNCVWEFTLACNLRCAHCGSRAGRPRDGELSTGEALDVVDQLAALECDLITLSGGEPLIRKDWHIVARAIADRGIHANMVTNGTLLDRDRARRCVDSGMCNVGVSIDGPEAIHDQIRGKGAWGRTIAGVEHLRAAGMSVGILTHVNLVNIHRLEEIRQLAILLGADSWRMQLGKPMGSMHERDDLVIRPRQLLWLIPQIAMMKEAGGIVVNVGDSIGYYGPHDQTLRGRGWRGREECWQGCQAGLQAIGIESDGGIKGCLSLQARNGDIDPFREGSLREASLADLWFRPGMFAYNREFDVHGLTGYCRRCSKAAVCRGGARCVASAATGGVTEDPYCFLRVSRLEERPGLRQAIAKGAAAAAAALLLGVAGCGTGGGGDATTDAVAETATDQGPVPDALDVSPDKDAIDCSKVCCNCDYGIPPTPEEFAACCKQPDVPPPADVIDVPPPKDVPDVPPPTDVIDCDAVCCACDYGVIPPELIAACCGQDIVEPADVPPPKEDVIDCSDVCCQCEYGIIPPDVWQACCAPEVIEPADVPPPKEDVIDCSDVCCMCEYGIIPPEVWEACCAPKDAVEAGPVDCESLACIADKDKIPADVFKECCEPCGTFPGCCDCDYGETPPPQCCK